MAQDSTNDVIRRKAKAGTQSQGARVMSPGRALRLALSRTAEELFELDVAVSGVQYEQQPQEAMLRAFDEEMLFLVLDGPEGALGAAALDLPLVAGFVEQQTIGRVSSAQSGGRAATATDAALIAPYIDAALVCMSQQFDDAKTRLGEGFSFGARLESKRHLGLIVEAADFHLMRAQLELAGGAKRGELILCLPIWQAPPMRTKTRPPKTETAGEAVASDGPKLTLEQGDAMQARALMRAVIHREMTTLGALSELSVGDTLAIPVSALGRLELDAGTGSPRLGPCRLGKQDGSRALRLGFGAEGVKEAAFEPMDHEPLLFADEPDMDLSDETEAGATQKLITVDDMPDLSDLPGLDPMPSLSEAG